MMVRLEENCKAKRKIARTWKFSFILFFRKNRINLLFFFNSFARSFIDVCWVCKCFFFRRYISKRWGLCRCGLLLPWQFFFLSFYFHTTHKNYTIINTHRELWVYSRKRRKRERGTCKKWSSYAIRGGGHFASSSSSSRLYK